MSCTPIHLKRLQPSGIVVTADDTMTEPQIELVNQSLDFQSHHRGFAWLADNFRPIRTVIDAGAFIGDSAFAALNAGATTVYAFEPFYETFCALCINLPQPQVIKINLPVGDGRHVFLDTASHEYPGMRHVKVENPLSHKVLIQTVCLADYCKDLTSLDLINLDVEGFEIQAISGAEQLIRRFRPAIFCEVFPEQLARYGGSAEALLEKIRDLGYSIAPEGIQPGAGWNIRALPL